MNTKRPLGSFVLILLALAILTSAVIAGRKKDPKNISKNMSEAKNVLGGKLESCCTNPVTGFFRDGYCRTNHLDQGVHVVCAVVDDKFLNFSRSRGNDLITPLPEYNFPGLKAGDSWCLCALRWKEAYQAGLAPMVNLRATHQRALDFIPLEILQEFAN